MSHPTPGPDGRLRTQQIATQDYMREPPPKTADRLANMLDYKQAQLLQAKEEEDWRRAKADGEYLKAAEAASSIGADSCRRQQSGDTALRPQS